MRREFSEDLSSIVDSFLSRYTTTTGRRSQADRLSLLFRMTERTHPAQLTEADIFHYCQSGTANNTNRARIAACRVFLRWCRKHGYSTLDMEEELSDLRK